MGREWVNKVRVFILEWTTPLNVLHVLYQQPQTLANRHSQMCPWRRTDKTQQNRRWDAAGGATPEPWHILLAYFISLFSASPLAGWECRVTCQQTRSKANRAPFHPWRKQLIRYFSPVRHQSSPVVRRGASGCGFPPWAQWKWLVVGNGGEWF